MNKEALEKRVSELTKQREQMLANVNVICGQLFELQHMLGQIDNMIPTLETKEPLKLDSVK